METEGDSSMEAAGVEPSERNVTDSSGPGKRRPTGEHLDTQMDTELARDSPSVSEESKTMPSWRKLLERFCAKAASVS